MSYNNRNNNRNNNSTAKKAWAPKPEKPTAKKSVYDLEGKIKTAKVAGINRNKNNNLNFMDALSNTRSSIYDLSLTTNGAVAHSTSGSKLLDINFAVSSLRNKSDKEIAAMFRKAFNENPVYAMRWLFYARDVREGLGERNLFRVCMNDLSKNQQEALVNTLIPIIAEYGRWDDVVELLKSPKSKTAALRAITVQLNSDISNMLSNKPVSLLGKWLPSEQASSKDTKKAAYTIMKHLKYTPTKYRKALSALRKYLDIVERKMSSDNWQAIDYETVPSKANLIYKKAFLKHDYERRSSYLEAISKGEAKINSSVAFPHEIVHKYNCNSYYNSPKKADAALEAMWKSLPNLVNGDNSTLVVADGSGSMQSVIGKTSVTALEVAQALAIYFAERCDGQFQNKFITFSETPQLVSVDEDTLFNKIRTVARYTEAANTNIEAVFELILATAKRYKMSQEQMPKNILIISDMQFDSCATSGKPNTNRRGGYYYGGYGITPPTKTLFDTIAQKYGAAGYKLPKLIFWNVMGKTDTIPMRENELGVTLVSGFSVNTCKMVMSNKLDAYEALIDTISDKRYDAVEKAVLKVAKHQK